MTKKKVIIKFGTLADKYNEYDNLGGVETKIKNGLKLFDQFKFLIPGHQRTLQWNRNRTLKVLNQFTKFNGDKISLGEIHVYYNEKTGNYEINDGGHRISILSLTLAAIVKLTTEYANRKEYHSEKDKLILEANNIHDFLIKRNSKTLEKESFITSDVSGGDVLNQLLLNPHRLIKELNEMKRRNNDGRSDILEWNKNIIDNFLLIYRHLRDELICPITVAKNIIRATELTLKIHPTKESARNAFNIINTVGAPAKNEALIKANIYGEKNSKILLEKWDRMRDVFSTEKQINDYILHFIRSFHKDAEKLTQGNLNEYFEDQLNYNDDFSVEKFVDDIYKTANIYLAVTGKKSSQIFSPEEEIRFKIADHFNFTSHIPLYLFASKATKKSDFIKIMDAQEKFQFAKQTLKNKEGRNVTEPSLKVLKQLKEIHNGKDKITFKEGQLEKILKPLSVENLNPKALKVAIEEFINKPRVTSNEQKVVKGLYLRIYTDHTNKWTKKIQPSLYHIDHLFARNPIKGFVKRFGVDERTYHAEKMKAKNLRLFYKDDNISLGNGDPIEKREIYIEDEIVLNKILPEISNDFLAYTEEAEAILRRELYRIYNLDSEKILKKVI